MRPAPSELVVECYQCIQNFHYLLFGIQQTRIVKQEFNSGPVLTIHSYHTVDFPDIPDRGRELLSNRPAPPTDVKLECLST